MSAFTLCSVVQNVFVTTSCFFLYSQRLLVFLVTFMLMLYLDIIMGRQPYAFLAACQHLTLCFHPYFIMANTYCCCCYKIIKALLIITAVLFCDTGNACVSRLQYQFSIPNPISLPLSLTPWFHQAERYFYTLYSVGYAQSIDSCRVFLVAWQLNIVHNSSPQRAKADSWALRCVTSAGSRYIHDSQLIPALILRPSCDDRVKEFVWNQPPTGRKEHRN